MTDCLLDLRRLLFFVSAQKRWLQVVDRQSGGIGSGAENDAVAGFRRGCCL
jgi:hypothetical protein